MKSAMPFFAQLFRYISYTARMRIVCGIGLLSVATILFFIFYVQYPLVNMYQLKLSGVKHTRLLIEQLKESCQNELLISRSRLDGSNLKSLEGHILATHDILNSLHNSNQIYGLNLEVDFKNYLISDVMLLHLPVTFAFMAEIEARRLNPGQHESREMRIESIQREMKVILQEIVLIGKNQFDGQVDLLRLFQNYQNTVSEYLAQKGPIPPESIAQIFQIGWDLENSMMTQFEQSQQAALQTLYNRQNSAAIISGLLVLAFIFIYFTRIIQSPVNALKIAAQHLSQGDVSVHVPITSNDEVAEITKSFNKMAGLWKQSVAQIKMIGNILVESSTSIFESAKRLDENVSKQEKIIGDIQQQGKEIASIGLKYSDLVYQVYKGIKSTSASVSEGTTSLAEMENIKNQMIQASKQILGTLDIISKQVDKINPAILSVISIADQSNLLSLNTTIRAGRPEGSGKGFVVVADKIRELASQQAGATFDLEQNVQEIVLAVSNAMTVVEKFSTQMTAYVDDERHLNEQLKMRLKQTRDQFKSFDQINDGMQDQFMDSQQIVELITHLSEATDNTENSVHKLYRDTEFLFKGTQELHKLLEAFKGL